MSVEFQIKWFVFLEELGCLFSLMSETSAETAVYHVKMEQKQS